jgi:hypothetical protein
MNFGDGEKNQCNWFSPQISLRWPANTRALRLGSFRRRGTERVARPPGISAVLGFA